MRHIILISILFIALCSAVIAQSDTHPCPKIKIYVSGDRESTVHFFAEVQNFTGPDNLTYDWQLTGALKLMSGEKSKQMEAHRTSEDGGTVTVTVTPFPAGCENRASESTSVFEPLKPELIDEFAIISAGTRKANLDNFFIRLIDNPGSRGLIVISNGKGALAHARTLVKHMRFLKKDMSLVSLVFNSEPGDKTQFWLIPPGSLELKYEDAVYVRAQDFVNLERIFNPAKVTRKKNR